MQAGEAATVDDEIDEVTTGRQKAVERTPSAEAKSASDSKIFNIARATFN